MKKECLVRDAAAQISKSNILKVGYKISKKGIIFSNVIFAGESKSVDPNIVLKWKF